LSKPTVYTIAKRCGVSPSTVSRAFSRPEVISEAVKGRIYAVAKELNYRPNLLARGLTTGFTATVGLLIPDVTNPFFPPLIRAIGRAAEDRGLVVLLADVDGRHESDILTAISDRVDGVIIAAARSTDLELSDIAQRLPVVLANRRVEGVPSVLCNNEDALLEAVRHLADLGHKEIAYLQGPSGSWASKVRAKAISAEAARSQIKFTTLGPFPSSFEGGRAAGAAVAETTATGALFFDDVMAWGGLAELDRMGISVPDDLSVIGCDDALLSAMLTPPLTTVAVPFDRLGQLAVEVLTGRIANPTADPAVISCTGRFVRRASTGPYLN
jgi:LacI family transcriptional regulator